MAKKLSKILWYGAEKDALGKPIIPPLSPSVEKHLEGLNEGEIYIHNDDEYPALYIRTNKDKIVAIGGAEALMKYFLRKDQPDTAREVITFEKGLNVGEFVTGASGASFFKDLTTGQTIMELDKLYVRMKAFFETLTIVEAQTISGKQIISPAGSVRCTNVEEYDDYYRCYFLNEQDGEKIDNKFIVGDQVYSQMFNAKTGTSNKISNRYYWRLVTGVGENYIDLSKTDCDADSDIPMVGDVLNHRGHRYAENSERMSFIETSTVDGFSPSITLFYGVNSFSLSGKDYVQFGVDKTTNKAFMNVYGDMYVGDRNKTAYMRYTQEEGLVICGKLDVGTKLGDSYLKDLISASTPEGYQEFVEKVTQDLEGLQAQIDGTIDSYFFQYEPSLNNYPASDWDTENEKKAHLNDTFTNLGDGRSWRWAVADGVYTWVEITDTATTKALALAGKAQDTADGKRRVFVDTPYPPYDKGDLWSRGSDYPLMICVVPKASGAYEEGDFDYADNNAKLKQEMQTLVTDTKDELNNAIGQAKNEAVTNANKYTDEGKAALQESINALERAKANITDVYTQVQADKKISESEERALKAAEEEADAAIAYYDTIVKAYADGVATEEELAVIAGAKAALDAAKKYAEEQAEAAKSEIENSYLFQALQDAQSTEIANGLVLTSLIQLRDTESNIMSGINGLINANKGDKSIATWWGGDMLDLIDYYRWDGTQWVVKSGLTAPSNIPSGLIRMDGTGYLAKGKFWWDNDGKIYADPTALFLSFDVNAEEGTLSATILDIRDKQTEFANMWTEKTDSNGTKYLYTTYPLVTQGGVTMYAGTSGLDVEGIYDGLPIDGKTIYWENEVLKAVGGGGTADAVAWENITGKPSFATVATSGSYNDLLNKPTLLSSFTNDVGFITNDVDGSMRIGSTVYISDSDTVYGVELYGTDEVGVIGVHSYGAWKCANISLYPNGYTTLCGNTTVNGNLIISTGADSKLVLDNTDNDTKYQYISFRQNGTEYGSLGTSYDNNLLWNQAYVLTSGNYTSYTYSKSDIDSKLSGYLPLSGTTGTLSYTNNTAIVLKNSGTGSEIGVRYDVGSKNGAWIGYESNYGVCLRNYTPNKILGIKDDGTPYYDSYTLLHSGNYSSYALPLTGGALTGNVYFGTDNTGVNATGSATRLPSHIYRNVYETSGNVYDHYYNNNYTASTNTFANLRVKTSGGFKVLRFGGDGTFTWDGKTIYHSGNLTKLSQLTNDSGFITSSASISGNAATATKLATARTIWGQSFDGTRNVSGDLYMGTSSIRGASNLDIINNVGNWVILGHGTAESGYNTYIDGNDIYLRYGTTHANGLVMNSSGNVGIGTVTPIEKLHVEGKILSNSIRIFGAEVTDNSKGLFIQASDKTNRAWITWNGNIANSDYLNIATHYGNIVLAPAGNVGIGTTNPTAKLHITSSLTGPDASNSDILINGTGSYSTWHRVFTYNNSNLTAGATPNIYFGALESKYNGGYIGFKYVGKDSSSNYVTIGLYGADNLVSILGNGNVGIGTISPQYKLDVNGAIKSTSEIWGNLFYFTSASAEKGWFGSPNNAGSNDFVLSVNSGDFRIITSNTDRMRITSSGNVGIGTTNPSQKLGVEGSIWANGNGTFNWSTISRCNIYENQIQMFSKSYGGYVIYSGLESGEACRFEVLNSNGGWTSQGWTLFQNGNITMGTTNDYGYKLGVTGSVYISSNLLTGGGITMYSARVLKNVIDEDGLSLRELSVIKPTRYTWKDKRDERLHIGGIADDIQQVLPEVVYRTPDGILTMDYGNAGFAIASSLIKPVIDHEQRIKALEIENEELKQEIKRLKA